jgi:hypothetical protein
MHEGSGLVEVHPGLEAVVELAQEAVKAIPLGGRVPVAGLTSTAVVLVRATSPVRSPRIRLRRPKEARARWTACWTRPNPDHPPRVSTGRRRKSREVRDSRNWSCRPVRQRRRGLDRAGLNPLMRHLQGIGHAAVRCRLWHIPVRSQSSPCWAPNGSLCAPRPGETPGDRHHQGRLPMHAKWL